MHQASRQRETRAASQRSEKSTATTSMKSIFGRRASRRPQETAAGGGPGPGPGPGPAGDSGSVQASSARESSLFSAGPQASSTGQASSSGYSDERAKPAERVRSAFHDMGKPLRVVRGAEDPVPGPLAVLDEEPPADWAPAPAPAAQPASAPAAAPLLPMFPQLSEGVSVPMDSRGSMAGAENNDPPLAAQHSVARGSVTAERVHSELSFLEEQLAQVMADLHQNVANTSTSVVHIIECFKSFLQVVNGDLPFNITSDDCESLRRVSKIVLHFLDNLLISGGFANSRSLLLRRYLHFLRQILPGGPSQPAKSSLWENTRPLPPLLNFCIDDDFVLPQRNKVDSIMNEILATDPEIISDQDGAFIAPVLRGLSRESAILTIIFGLPHPQQEHYDMINELYYLFPDVHFLCMKNQIKAAADVMTAPAIQTNNTSNNANSGFAQFASDVSEPSLQQHQKATLENRFTFIPPYRMPENPLQQPVSMSLSTVSSTTTTGTFGGYLYPQIEKGSKFKQFEGSAFAVTCAHVLLSESQDYPKVAVPSAVLQESYKCTLQKELVRYPVGSQEAAAFHKEIKRINDNLKWQGEHVFGQVVWGERSIIDKKLSDFAIVKVNEEYKCINSLGDDLTTILDPTLKFENTNIRRKIMKMKPGMSVFKIGASTQYTSGRVNGAKLIYWSEGTLQSSEFVVASAMPLFANAGDSGAWVLTKLEDRLGLGVVGMLHSYDGEQRQFGLFTPIGDILDRLHAVTSIHWDIDPQ